MKRTTHPARGRPPQTRHFAHSLITLLALASGCQSGGQIPLDLTESASESAPGCGGTLVLSLPSTPTPAHTQTPVPSAVPEPTDTATTGPSGTPTGPEDSATPDGPSLPPTLRPSPTPSIPTETPAWATPDPTMPDVPTPIETARPTLPPLTPTTTPPTLPPLTGTPMETLDPGLSTPTSAPPTLPPTAVPTPPELDWPLPTLPDPDQPWRAGTILASDTGGGRLTLVRALDGVMLWDYRLSDGFRSQCGGGLACQTHEAEHLTIDDEDYVDFVMSAAGGQWSSVHRIKPGSTSTVQWSIKGFDFSAVPDSGCSMPSTTTCQGGEGLPPQCYAWFVHAFHHVSDDPVAKTVTSLIADHSGRILKATLDYGAGSSCAKVEWIYNWYEPGWQEQCEASDMQVFTHEGMRHMLLTCRNTGMATGVGYILLLRQDESETGEVWERVWRYPESSNYLIPNLNTPHHGRLSWDEASGTWLLRYSHTYGMGTDWESGDRGTSGFARLDSLEDQPDYLADFYPVKSDGTHELALIKSSQLIPGDALLTADGGFNVWDVPLPTSIYVLPLAEGHDTDHTGVWDNTFSQLNLIPTSTSLAKFACGWSMLYQADYLPPSENGRILRSLVAMPTQPACSLIPQLFN